MAKKPSQSATAVLDPEADVPVVEQPVRHVAHSVFVVVNSTGKRGGQTDVPMHEVPLLRRKLKALGEDLNVIRLSDEHIRVRGETMESVQAIYGRLRGLYTFLPEGHKEGDEVDLVSSIYGNERDGLKSLAITMRALHRGYETLSSTLKRGKGPTVEDLDHVIHANGPEKTLENELLDVDFKS